MLLSAQAVKLDDSRRGSLFDALEDTDAQACAAKIAELVERQEVALV